MNNEIVIVDYDSESHLLNSQLITNQNYRGQWVSIYIQGHL